ncbi:Zn(II)2Cys6 transcription factor [Aspergillus pseudotamarii]|uniref:Zn(II)2Cys6 transcription factor n=1 Tax=Aspergillus pseudotamarii TaxID=132259 RepID=A0A5N6SKH9_ASPPS|nr:Zn(II)2Cys6 transcription factor [Aspergillus pseudotamarii]KAE8134260.1 Zn(II)2Cys6 transcription factor [Aspergillus pseudotamarii]
MRRVKKSRNGCARCKSKRVKCGEEKPYCSRCTRLGVKCPGYAQSLRWVTKYPSGTEDYDSNAQLNRSPLGSGHSPAPGPSTASPRPSQFPDTLAESPLIKGDANQTTTHEDPGPKGLGLDGSNTLNDSLWGLPEPGSLPELADLGPSPSSASASAVGHERASSIFDLDTPNDPGNPLNLFSSRAPESQHELPNFLGFSPSAIVRKYPPSNSQPPQRDLTSIPQLLNNPSWTLIEYYFKEVAALFSSYDSQMNPFRSTVSRLWGSSLAMCKTMQSMAAATLVNDFPQFGPLGRKLRNEAVDIIAKETVLDDKSLLALLMLGQTASWHDSKDLGISFFNLLRNHLETKPLEIANPERGNNHQFFQEALVYWEMLLSFVADDTAVLSGNAAADPGGPLVLQRIPHPWTGIARDTQFTVQEVGRLVRCERKRIRARVFTSRADITQAQKAIEKAQELEERLLELAHPAEAEIVSPGDDETPVWHLLTMAEVYRCTGLMQLYRVFPDLLYRRLGSQHPSSQSYNQQPSATPRDPFLSVDTAPDLINSAWFESMYLQPESNQPNESETLPDTYYDSWLTEFSLTTLSRLKTIPIESRTRCLQPFLLVASSSELRLPRSEVSLDSSGPNISSHAIEVSRTRQFVLGRLTSFLHVLPPKPVDVCLQLVREVWKRIDAGESNAYWMDVMMEKGWETTMG